VRRFGGRESKLLKIFFDCGAKFGGFERAAKAREYFALGGKKQSIGNGFYRFEEVKGLGSRTNEGVSDAVPFGKNEKTSGGSFVTRNA
jgi:hypothetical protein